MLATARFHHLTPRDHLHRLWVMRNVALMGQASVIAITVAVLHIELPLMPIIGIVLLLAVFNLVTWWRLKNIQTVSTIEIFAQFWVDLTVLSLLLYFTGGGTNPFVSFYLPILAVAAASLPAPYVWFLSGFSLTCYTVLGFEFEPLKVGGEMSAASMQQVPPNVGLAITYHLAGMWANFVIGASWIAWFVLRMSNDLREGDRALATARQRLLQDARVVALAAQAARTAHELGTPLSSIAVAAGELAAACATDPSLRQYQADVATIESQVEACRHALYDLRDEAPQSAEDVVDVSEWLPRFVFHWRLSHPAVRLECEIDTPARTCEAAVMLGQVLTIVLDNAARASEAIHLHAHLGEQTLYVVLDDQGPGLPAELRESIGSAPVPSRSGGRGWGLFLAYTAVEARGGRITIVPRRGGGTRVELDWPLAKAVTPGPAQPSERELVR